MDFACHTTRIATVKTSKKHLKKNFKRYQEIGIFSKNQKYLPFRFA
jgi:hypothetical protein